MSEVIIALLRTECGDEGADPAREARNSSLGCFSEMRFEFAERLLDRIEVRRIFGEVTQSRTGRFNQFSHTGNLVTGRLSIITMSPRLRVGMRHRLR